MVPRKDNDTLGGSGRAKTPDTHLGNSSPLLEEVRYRFDSEEAFRTWLESRDRQCSRDPKFVGDKVYSKEAVQALLRSRDRQCSHDPELVPGIISLLPGDTD
jgi:hypothetical protein